MSYFPSDDPHRDTMSGWEDYTYCQPRSTSNTTPTTRECNHISNVNDSMWSIAGAPMQGPYTIVQPMPWSSEPPRGLGLETLRTPTQPMFESSYAACNDLAVPATWHRPSSSLAPHETYQGNAHYSSTLEQWYPTSATMGTALTWSTAPAHAAPFNAASDASPGHSNYSISSASSVVASSPYAHSEGCFQPASPPHIKQEEFSDRSSSRLHSIPGRVPSHQPLHVNPGDVYTTPPLSAAERMTFSEALDDQKTEPEDSKSASWHQASTPRRTVSLEDTRGSVCDARAKRGFTTQANSTCECEKCGKLFQRSYNLKAHMETHDPQREQPHACPYEGCKRRFVRRTDLVRHQQSVGTTRSRAILECYG